MASFLKGITPLILTYNEEANLERTLGALGWASRVVIVDSFSTDETLNIAARHSRVAVFQRHFDSFASQCNYGLTQIHTEWVLSMDADYVLSAPLVDELASLRPTNDISGYYASFTYCIFGRPLRASLYPPRVVLYRPKHATYHDEGHGHRVQVDGPTAALQARIYHDDRKPLGRWLAAQDRYSQQEARLILDTPVQRLNRADRLRKKMIFAPLAILFYTLCVRGVIFDGIPGWYYAFQRTLAEILLSLRIMEQKLTKPF